MLGSLTSLDSDSDDFGNNNNNDDYIGDHDVTTLSQSVSNLIINGRVDVVRLKEQQLLVSSRAHGLRQSPIDIDCTFAEYDSGLRSLELDYLSDDKARLVNEGKTPVCYVTPGKHFLDGGPLSQSYELVQYHIHFSGHGAHGSEHTVNGHGYPAEIHFVHYKVSYGDLASALKHPDGLAVVGAFIEFDNNNGAVNEQLDSDVRKMANIVETGSVYDTIVNLAKYEVAKSRNFFHYSGSLTTAPYQECVEWILLAEPISISAEAFQILRELKSSDGGTMFEHGNSRSTQAGHGRRIRCNCLLR